MANVGQMVRVEMTEGGTVIGRVILTQDNDGERWHKVMVEAGTTRPGFAPWLKGETVWSVEVHPFASHAEGRRAIAFL